MINSLLFSSLFSICWKITLKTEQVWHSGCCCCDVDISKTISQGCVDFYRFRCTPYQCTLIVSCLCFLFILFQEKAISIWESKDFFVELDPLPGGVEAVKEMAKLDK